jgi:hypothetical protein
VIHIAPRPEDVPPEWLEKACKLTQQLRECMDDASDVSTAAQKRRSILEAHDDQWQALKHILSRWSFDKCWYSELRESGSDYHVDHFRPKGRVRNEGEEEREGYWWLAFEWTNYRLAASWANSSHRDPGKPSQGKADQFPLKPGTNPVGPDGNIENEIPLLLDPTNEFDVQLVDFDETGLPIPAVSGGWAADRVIGTRRLLHLDSQRMVEARQEVWRRCTRLLEKANGVINATADEYTTFHDTTTHDWVREICMMLRPDAELSAVALACVIKSEYVWARKLPCNPLSMLR